MVFAISEERPTIDHVPLTVIMGEHDKVWDSSCGVGLNGATRVVWRRRTGAKVWAGRGGAEAAEQSAKDTGLEAVARRRAESKMPSLKTKPPAPSAAPKTKPGGAKTAVAPAPATPGDDPPPPTYTRIG